MADFRIITSQPHHDSGSRNWYPGKVCINRYCPVSIVGNAGIR